MASSNHYTISSRSAVVALRFFGVLQLWCDRSEQRRRLALLDDRMLKDIGINTADADRESSKWFWQD